MYLSVTLGLSVALSLYYGSYRHASLILPELAKAGPSGQVDELVLDVSSSPDTQAEIICPPPPLIELDPTQDELESQIEQLRDDAIGAYIEQEELRRRARAFVKKVEEITGVGGKHERLHDGSSSNDSSINNNSSNERKLASSSCVTIEDIEKRLGELFTIDDDDVGKPAGWDVNREDGLWIGDEILMAKLKQHVEEVKEEEKVKLDDKIEAAKKKNMETSRSKTNLPLATCLSPSDIEAKVKSTLSSLPPPTRPDPPPTSPDPPPTPPASSDISSSISSSPPQNQQGLVDVAVNARVVPSLTSPTYVPKSSYPLLSRVPSWILQKMHLSPTSGFPSEIISNQTKKLGDCWAFDGNEGQVGLYLSKRVEVHSISLSHIDPTFSPDISSSVKVFTVSGYKSVREATENVGRINYGTFTYYNSDVEVGQFEGGGWEEGEEGEKESSWSLEQRFEVLRNGMQTIRVLVLGVEDNWGMEEFTCLYKLRVYEKLEKEEDEDIDLGGVLEEAEEVEVEVGGGEGEKVEEDDKSEEKDEEVMASYDPSQPPEVEMGVVQEVEIDSEGAILNDENEEQEELDEEKIRSEEEMLSTETTEIDAEAQQLTSSEEEQGEGEGGQEQAGTDSNDEL